MCEAGVSVADLEGFLWFLQKPPFETRRNPSINLYTAIELVNLYLETLEIFSTYVRQRGCTFLILDISFPLRKFIRIARVIIFMKRKVLDIRSFFS